jgi:hypothetical protein
MQGWGGPGVEGGVTTLAGLVSGDVESVSVDGPDGKRTLAVSTHGTFIAVYKGVVAPRDVPVSIHLRDGSVQRYTGPGVHDEEACFGHPRARACRRLLVIATKR